MVIRIRVFPESKRNAVEKKPDDRLFVYTKAKAKDGAANDAVRDLLAKHFQVPRSAVRITRGRKAPNKHVTINHTPEV